MRNEEVQADLNTIGGRGVGNGEGDQPNFSRGGGGGLGLDPQGGNKFRLSERGKGGIKDKTENFIDGFRKAANFLQI